MSGGTLGRCARRFGIDPDRKEPKQSDIACKKECKNISTRDRKVNVKNVVYPIAARLKLVK